MKNKLFLLSVLLLLISSCNGKVPKNLVNNAGFELQETNGLATAWSTSVHAGEPAYNFSIDKETVFEGKSSFKIEQYSEQGFGLVAQQVILNNNSLNNIVFSAKILANDIIEGNGAQLVVNFQNDDGYIIKQVRSDSITGTTDWVDLSLNEAVPKGTTNLNIGIMLRTIGNVWVDRVSLFIE